MAIYIFTLVGLFEILFFIFLVKKFKELNVMIKYASEVQDKAIKNFKLVEDTLEKTEIIMGMRKPSTSKPTIDTKIHEGMRANAM